MSADDRSDARSPIHTPESVERGYNNRAAVPEHPQWLARYSEQSRKAVASLSPEIDIRYGPGAKETLDLFMPAGTPRGTLMFIHGGYWRALDKSDFSFVAPPLVERGLAVEVVNYDLCPDVSIDAITDQCRRAVEWHVREGPMRGLDAGPLVVAGHSAGGHLVAMLFATDWRQHGLTGAPFVGGVTLSGVHDLTPLTLSTMNADLHLDDAQARRLSPASLDAASAAPLLVACGADETSEFLRQSQLIFDAWPRNRPPRMDAPLFIPGRHHFSVVMDLADAQSALSRAVLALFGPD